MTFRDARLITPAEEIGLIALFGTEVLVEAPLDPIVLKRIIEVAKTSRSLAPVFKKYL